MNDAERDAWLREALRHAPDSGALPPRGVSEAILAEARAAARAAQPVPAVPTDAARPGFAKPWPPAGRAPGAATNPLLVLWDWLARPPVAAGFASVMAATLVGLMWWDRPMDETLPRRPDAVADRPAAPAPSKTAAAKSEAEAPAQVAAAPTKSEERESTRVADAPRAAPPGTAGADRTTVATTGKTGPAGTTGSTRAANAGTTGETAQARRQSPAGQSAATGGANDAAPVEDAGKKRIDALAKERVAAPAERKAAAPVPFPTPEDRSAALAEKTPTPQAKSKDIADSAKPAADAPAPTATAAPPAVGRLRAQPEAPPPVGRRSNADELARPPAANQVEGDARKSAPAAAATEPAPSPTLPSAVPSPVPAPVPAPSMRGGALGDAREKQASAFATPPAAPAAPARSELAAAQRARPNTAAAPLAPILAAIASEPARWSRSSAAGSVVALEPGWHDWLAELDAGTAGLWRAAGDRAADNERGGATTLRLVAAGRAPLTVRLDGTTARLDGAAPGERWQASLPTPAAERLRAAAARLPP